MNNSKGNKENKGGLLTSLATLFRGGAAAGNATGVTGGLFASKAGLLGLVLGGATIAAGVGFVYNYVGDSGNKAYSPELFQNSYYEEEAAKAGAERNQYQSANGSANSTIGMFSASAKKSGMGFEVKEETESAPSNVDESSNASAEAPSYGAGGDAKTAVSNPSQTKANKLTSRTGELSTSLGGGSSTSASAAPRMKSMGGLSGGIGAKFASMKQAGLANGGKTSSMTASAKAKVSKGRSASARYKGTSARSQAKFANAMGNKAVYTASAAGSRTAAESAFTGETAGTGDVDTGVLEGAGLGGAGLSVGDALKSNDPNANNSIKNIPEPTPGEDESPWKDIETAIFILLASASALLVVGSLMAQKAAKCVDAKTKMIWYGITAAIAALVDAAAVAIVVLSVIMATKYNQKMTGIMYGIAGAFIAFKGTQLLIKAIGGYNDAKADVNAEKALANDEQFKGSQKEIGDKFNDNWKETEDGKYQYKDEDGNWNDCSKEQYDGAKSANQTELNQAKSDRLADIKEAQSSLKGDNKFDMDKVNEKIMENENSNAVKAQAEAAPQEPAQPKPEPKTYGTSKAEAGAVTDKPAVNVETPQGNVASTNTDKGIDIGKIVDNAGVGIIQNGLTTGLQNVMSDEGTTKEEEE